MIKLLQFLSLSGYATIGWLAAGNIQAETNTTPVAIEQLVVVGGATMPDDIIQVLSVATYMSATLGTAERIEDVVTTNPGVQVSSQNAGMETSLFIRGYLTDNSNVFVNGHQDIRRFFPRDLATVEQIHIIKGQASVLLGSGAPGGAIVYSTKMPQPVSEQTLNLSLGSYQYQRVSLDSTGNLLPEKLDYRLVVVNQTANSFMENVGNDKQLGLASLLWHYTPEGSLRFETEYDHLTNPYNYGTVRINQRILYDQSYVDPRANSDRDYRRYSLYWEQLLNEYWKLSSSLNYASMDRDDLMMGFYYKINEQLLRGHWADSDNDFWQKNARVLLSGDVQTNAITHKITLGVEANHLDNNLVRLHSTAFTLDPLQPDFNHPEPRNTAVHKDFHYADADQHLFVTDALTISPKLLVDLGTRFSQFYSTDRLQSKTTADNHAQTYFAGAHFQWFDDLSLYSNYTQSFEPNSGQDKAGNFFTPRDATQYEAGLRWQATEDIATSAAIYDLQQHHLLNTDPTDRLYQTAIGGRKTQGLELMSDIAVSATLKAAFSYSYLHNRMVENLDGLLGKTSSGIPKHMGSAELNWQMTSRANARVIINAIGPRYGDAQNSFTLPGYARLDANIAWHWEQTSIQLNIENLLDKRYIAAPFAEDDLYQGNRRDLTAKLSYKF